MKILGISAFYHDSAAALIIDGKIICAIEEERFSRVKHDNQFPYQAIQFCLDSMCMTIYDIDAIAYYEKPLRKFERLLETFAETYPLALKPFLSAIPNWLGKKINIEHIIAKELGFTKKNKIYYIPHHLSHAASAYYTSPFKKCAILTIDGVGEYQTTGMWNAQNEDITSLYSLDFPHSLGLLYSTFTAFLGFKVNEDEYKLMGLSAYGKPRYVNKIKQVIDIKPDGSFRLDLRFFGFRHTYTMWSPTFEKLFGKPRKQNEPIETIHKDIAASIQSITEEIFISTLQHLYDITKQKDLCISGGVGLNALANGKIYGRTPFKNIHILGSAGDSGGAIGAALFTYHSIFRKKPHGKIPTLYIGSSYSNEDIETVLSQYSCPYRRIDDIPLLLEKTATLLSKGKVIGWFQGKTEFGPRALGARSILSRPNPRSMKERVNIIKRREQFRPFAGSILQEHVHEYFHVPEENHYSPFMNFCFIVKEEKRGEIAAIVHKDNTCRIQTVNKDNGLYYRLLQAYYDITGNACILNTSFNLKGEPIVEHPKQAIEDFLKTSMDYLVIGNYFVSKGTPKFRGNK